MEITQHQLNEDIPVFYIQAKNFPESIPDSFNELEKVTGGFKGRHMYGVTACIGDQLIYRACSKEKYNGEAKDFGLPLYMIPKGNYLYLVLDNWRENLAAIPQLFDRLMKEPMVKKETICLEDYNTIPGKMLAMVQCA